MSAFVIWEKERKMENLPVVDAVPAVVDVLAAVLKMKSRNRYWSFIAIDVSQMVLWRGLKARIETKGNVVCNSDIY